MFKFELGEILKDKVTGFQGAVMAQAMYFTGCAHYALCFQGLKDGKIPEWEWIDTSRLERVKGAERVLRNPNSSAGGPQPNGPQV